MISNNRSVSIIKTDRYLGSQCLLRCSQSCTPICACYQSANCRVQLVLIRLSLRLSCQVLWVSWLLLLQNNWNCIMCTDSKFAVMNIYDFIFFSGRKWAVGTGDGVSLIQLANLNACTRSIHKHTTHAICGVLWLNHLPPKAYLFLSSYNTNTHQ